MASFARSIGNTSGCSFLVCKFLSATSLLWMWKMYDMEVLLLNLPFLIPPWMKESGGDNGFEGNEISLLAEELIQLSIKSSGGTKRKANSDLYDMDREIL
ncbi:hypothetical protein PVK06_042499 [Gossypium arboreum]|uniref:Uncharacterized protein n=1 Tax=Gossypium arboreum TaxID=29729 RepID=A0ABR0MKX0_GOSAR|nr:hypothetical protein PVK06_042499 [Gossypium arboreum]